MGVCKLCVGVLQVCALLTTAGSEATPEESTGAAVANRFWYPWIVLRSIPVTRSICRWLTPAYRRVQTLVCRCGSKTFTPDIPSALRGGK